MTIRQLPLPKLRFTRAGVVLSGGKVYTYEPGTSTLKATYTSSSGAVENANPVILDSNGEAEIWWDGLYKVVLKDSSDVEVYTVDNYGTGADPIAAPQDSLIKNYSFEDVGADADTPDKWDLTDYTNGSHTLDATSGNQRHGAQALKFTSAGSGGGYAESERFAVQEAIPFYVIVAMKSSVADVRNVIEIVWYDYANSLLSTDTLLDDSTTNQTSWADESSLATPPASACYAKLRLTGCHSSDATVGSTWFDNVRISEAMRVSGDQTVTGDKGPGGFAPAGAIMPYAGAAAPSGWLLCYGQAVSRTTYADLFAALSTTYGAGDGSTTFNLPDLRGRAVFGQDDMGGSAASRVTSAVSGVDGATLGASGGDQRSQQHNHTATDSGHAHTATSTDSGHAHSVTYYDGTGGLGNASESSNGVTGTYNTNSGTANITTTVNSGTANISVANSGSGASQNMPPALILNYIIKT